ncbi:major facilitator superfamily protein [Artemisia annua]|uniref:Major facilitator superfamily protein n=1 Tax=Artemisia annua TaxID=35608 RepID=A0A2U1Q5C9_ARTAN|nr:major facilitator superfamily protein [Artemisia annua]
MTNVVSCKDSFVEEIVTGGNVTIDEMPENHETAIVLLKKLQKDNLYLMSFRALYQLSKIRLKFLREIFKRFIFSLLNSKDELLQEQLRSDAQKLITDVASLVSTFFVFISVCLYSRSIGSKRIFLETLAERLRDFASGNPAISRQMPWIQDGTTSLDGSLKRRLSKIDSSLEDLILLRCIYLKKRCITSSNRGTKNEKGQFLSAELPFNILISSNFMHVLNSGKVENGELLLSKFKWGHAFLSLNRWRAPLISELDKEDNTGYCFIAEFLGSATIDDIMVGRGEVPAIGIDLDVISINAQSASMPSPESSNMSALPPHYSSQPPSVVQPTMSAASTHYTSLCILVACLICHFNPHYHHSLDHLLRHLTLIKITHMGPNAGYQHPGAPQLLHHSQAMFHCERLMGSVEEGALVDVEQGDLVMAGNTNGSNNGFTGGYTQHLENGDSEKPERRGGYRLYPLGPLTPVDGSYAILLYSVAWSSWIYLYLMINELDTFQLRSIVSKQVDPTEQGKAQGRITGLCSFASIVSPLIFSPLTALLSDNAPFVFPGFSLMCAAFFVVKYLTALNLLCYLTCRVMKKNISMLYVISKSHFISLEE